MYTAGSVLDWNDVLSNCLSQPFASKALWPETLHGKPVSARQDLTGQQIQTVENTMPTSSSVHENATSAVLSSYEDQRRLLMWQNRKPALERRLDLSETIGVSCSKPLTSLQKQIQSAIRFSRACVGVTIWRSRCDDDKRKSWRNAKQQMQQKRSPRFPRQKKKKHEWNLEGKHHGSKIQHGSLDLGDLRGYSAF